MSAAAPALAELGLDPPSGYRAIPRPPSGADIIGPQPGPQEQFLATKADIAVIGGSAGGGKSFALLLEPLRHLRRNGEFGGVIFRRTYPQITSKGGLWDTSHKVYPKVGGQPRVTTLEWQFRAGGTMKFGHMQTEEDRYQWDGSEIPYVAFDQVEHFSPEQFWYLLSRNRSTCGVRPYVRASANPDPDHEIRDFMRWWIDDKTGLAIAERSGRIRWFWRDGTSVEWADTARELVERLDPQTLERFERWSAEAEGQRAVAQIGEDRALADFASMHDASVQPMSFTFVRSSVFDNKILLARDPRYLARLRALPEIDKQRLLWGNWNARETAGMFFRRGWFEIVDAAPAELDDEIRYWDRASTQAPEGIEVKRRSSTVGTRMGRDTRGVFYVKDVVRLQGYPLTVKETIRNTALQDGEGVRIGLEGDPGQAGQAEAQDLVRYLAGFEVTVNTVRESKGNRAKPYSAQAKAGNVKLVRGPWNETFLRNHENFDGTPDCVSDDTDSGSGAFHCLSSPNRIGIFGKRRPRRPLTRR